MKPKTQDSTAFELFQAHFDQILNAQHPLVWLADRIDWPRFDAAFADSYNEELGAPGTATAAGHYRVTLFDACVAQA